MSRFRKKFSTNNLVSALPLISILLLAAYLRLWKIREYMTFLGDEGRDMLVVKRMIVDHDLTFLGPTASVGGFFLGPIYYYFMTPFVWLFHLDPVGPAVMVALFGIATVYLLYRVGTEWYSKEIGFIAAAFYSLSPLVIAHSRSSWNPNIVPFFSLLYSYSLYKAVGTQAKRWYFLIGVCIGVGLQLHYLFTFLLPVGAVYILLYDRSFARWRNYGFGVLGFLGTFGPFLAFEIKNGFPNFTTIFRYIAAGDEVAPTGNPLGILADVSYRLFARLVFFSPAPEQITITWFNEYWWWRFGIIVAIVGSLGCLGYLGIRYRRKQDVLLVIWLVFGVGLFAFYQRAIYDYYFVIMFTLPFLLFSILLTRLWRMSLLRPVVVMILAGVLYLNWNGRPFRHQPNRQADQVSDAAQAVLDGAAGNPLNFALITGSNSDHAYRDFMEIRGNPPIVIENFDNDPERTTVTDQLLVICEYPDCKPLGHPLWEIAGFGPAENAGEWEVGVLKVMKLVHAEIIEK